MAEIRSKNNLLKFISENIILQMLSLYNCKSNLLFENNLSDCLIPINSTLIKFRAVQFLHVVNIPYLISFQGPRPKPE